MLGYDSLGDKLLTFQLYDQQANVLLGIIPRCRSICGACFLPAVQERQSGLREGILERGELAGRWNRYAAATSKTKGLIFG